jgi:hypothetical protein
VTPDQSPPSVVAQLGVLHDQAQSRVVDAQAHVAAVRTALALAQQLEAVTADRDRLQRLLDAQRAEPGDDDTDR